jgi:hypothetical protein
MLPVEIEMLDRWIGQQPEKLSRPVAIRRLVGVALAAMMLPRVELIAPVLAPMPRPKRSK